MDKATIQNHFVQGYSAFYNAYLREAKSHGDKLQALCPFHKDKNPSLSIDIKTGLFHCFGCNVEGDIFDFYAKMKNLDTKKDFKKILSEIAQEFNIHNGNGKVKKELVTAYGYQDVSGALIYGVNRYKNPKSFSQWRPDGKGGLIHNIKDIKPLLYHLPEVIKTQQVIIVEGEKDADNLLELGFMATCNSGGAGKWRNELSNYLKDKDLVLIPDNDEPGKKHMDQVAASLKGKARSIKLIDLPGLPEKGDISDWIEMRYPCDPEGANERLCIMIDGAPEYKPKESGSPKEENKESSITLINASDWLKQEPPEPDEILQNMFEPGDKVAFIGLTKLRKSFLFLQGILCYATGRDFLIWQVPRARKVVYIQLEIKGDHLHRRLKRLCRAMGITSQDLGDRLLIINGRGLGITGPEGIKRIWDAIKDFKPEIIGFDPLYKIMTGVENAAEDGKKILQAFDELIEKSGAAVLYVHHDAKGSPGDRDIRDRGAGSNVLARDYDAALTLTQHATDQDTTVTEVLSRNYRPQEPFTIQWKEDELTGGYRFELRPDILPEKKTSKSKQVKPDLSLYLPIAEKILDSSEYEISAFKTRFKEKTGLGDHRIRDFIKWATTGEKPYFSTREIRADRRHEKWISKI
jgi:hypothetical protein